MTNVSGGAAPGGGASSVRRLRRRTENKVVAGVAGGLADYLNVPAWMVRLAFVILAFTGAGVLLYVVGWVLIPAEGEAESLADRAMNGAVDGPAWLGGLLLLIGAILIASHTHLVAPALVWGLALIVLGVYVFRRSERGEDRRNASASAVATTLPPPASETTTPSPWIATGIGDVATPPPPPMPAGLEPAAATTETLPVAAPPVARPPRERSALGWFVLGLALAVAGLLVTLDQAGAVSLRPGQYLGLILAILGGGILVGAWIGRARWLVLPALLLLPVVAAASLIHVPLRGGFGDRTYAPVATTDVRGEYRLIAGHLTLDLRDLDLGASTVTVRASVVAGRLDVIVPPGANVVVTGSVSAGSADLFGTNRDGSNVPLAIVNPGSGSGTLRLNLGASYGYVRVGGPDDSSFTFSKQAGAVPVQPAAPLTPPSNTEEIVP